MHGVSDIHVSGSACDENLFCLSQKAGCLPGEWDLDWEDYNYDRHAGNKESAMNPLTDLLDSIS